MFFIAFVRKTAKNAYNIQVHIPVGWHYDRRAAKNIQHFNLTFAFGKFCF